MKKYFLTLLMCLLCSTGHCATSIWANNGEDKVRQDETRSLDAETVTNETWDGTTILLKEASNAFAQFSIYIETDANLTNITVELSDLDKGEDTLNYVTRETDELFDFTQSDMEMFYVRYLEARGLRGGDSGSSYDAGNLPEDRWHESMQRDCTEELVESDVYYNGYYKCMADDGEEWTDREGAGKFYPSILIPIELEPTFDISADESQQIWVDIWIPKSTTIGTYTGTITVKDDGVTIKAIPIELEVYDFELPDAHYLKTWAFQEWSDTIDRWMGTRYPNYSSQDAPTKAMMVEVWKNHQFILRRHGLNFANEEYSTCDFADNIPADEYRDYYNMLSGDLFSAANKYDGPAIEDQADIYVMGTYGRWRNLTGFGGFYPDTDETCTGDCSLDDFSAENYNADEYTESDIDFVVKIDAEGTPDTFKWSDDDGSTWEVEDVEITGDTQYVFALETGKTISAITATDPPLITVNNTTDLYDNNYIYFDSVGGMTELNGNDYILDDVSNTTFTLNEVAGGDVDASGFTPFTSGGTAQKKSRSSIKFSNTTGHVLNDEWSWSSLSKAESEAVVQTSVDTCWTNLEDRAPGIKKMLFMMDEPFDNKSSWKQIDLYSDWVDGATENEGATVQTYVTASHIASIESGNTNVDSITLRNNKRDCWNRLAENSPYNYVNGLDYYTQIWNGLGKEMQIYNGPWEFTNRVDRLGWHFFKDNIEWNLLWQIGLWINNEGGYQFWNEKTDLFTQASTLGPAPSDYGYDEEYGWKTKGNGNGVLLFPGTDVYYKDYTFDANTGTLDDYSYCSTDGGDSYGICVSQGATTIRAWVRTGSFDEDDVVIDESAHSVTLTGVEAFPDTNYGVNGEFASIRLKNYRKTIQDYDYLYMANENCSSCVNTIISGAGFIKGCEEVYDWGNIYYGGGGQGWHMNHEEYGSLDYFEKARAELANIILGNNPPSKFKGSFNGLSK